jgi:hypothetical protein
MNSFLGSSLDIEFLGSSRFHEHLIGMTPKGFYNTTIPDMASSLKMNESG